MNLDDLQPGESGIIKKVEGEDSLRLHLLDMGLIPGTKVEIIKRAPLGDPVELRLRGYELTLRREDAAHITVSRFKEEVK